MRPGTTSTFGTMITAVARPIRRRRTAPQRGLRKQGHLLHRLHQTPSCLWLRRAGTQLQQPSRHLLQRSMMVCMRVQLSLPTSSGMQLPSPQQILISKVASHQHNRLLRPHSTQSRVTTLQTLQHPSLPLSQGASSPNLYLFSSQRVSQNSCMLPPRATNRLAKCACHLCLLLKLLSDRQWGLI